MPPPFWGLRKQLWNEMTVPIFTAFLPQWGCIGGFFQNQALSPPGEPVLCPPELSRGGVGLLVPVEWGHFSLLPWPLSLSAFPLLSAPGQAALSEGLVCPSPSAGDREARHLPGQQLLCHFSLGPKTQGTPCLPPKRWIPFRLSLWLWPRGFTGLLCKLDAAVGQQAGRFHPTGRCSGASQGRERRPKGPRGKRWWRSWKARPSPWRSGSF